MSQLHLARTTLVALAAAAAASSSFAGTAAAGSDGSTRSPVHGPVIDLNHVHGPYLEAPDAQATYRSPSSTDPLGRKFR